jgi:hypothetical protein
MVIITENCNAVDLTENCNHWKRAWLLNFPSSCMRSTSWSETEQPMQNEIIQVLCSFAEWMKNLEHALFSRFTAEDTVGSQKVIRHQQNCPHPILWNTQSIHATLGKKSLGKEKHLSLTVARVQFISWLNKTSVSPSMAAARVAADEEERHPFLPPRCGLKNSRTKVQKLCS